MGHKKKKRKSIKLSKKAKFFCKVCGHTTETEKAIKRHCQTKHPNAKLAPSKKPTKRVQPSSVTGKVVTGNSGDSSVFEWLEKVKTPSNPNPDCIGELETKGPNWHSGGA